MNDIKTMNLDEFVKLGLLQEVNRRFFHPMGLALSVVSEMDRSKCVFGDIWDYRDDPEGIIFGDEVSRDEEFKQKAETIDKMLEEKRATREKNLGWHIQPVEDK